MSRIVGNLLRGFGPSTDAPIFNPDGPFNCPHAAVAHSVQATIRSLIGSRITGIVADSVRVRKVPLALDFQATASLGFHTWPGILIVYGDRERDVGGVNDRDDIGYPVVVLFATKDVDDHQRSDPEANDDLYLTWRQVVSDVFRNQPYSVSNYAPENPLTFYDCTIEYGPIVDRDRWFNDQTFVGAVTLVFVLRKPRG